VRRDFIDEVGRMLKIGRNDMIEKDIILTRSIAGETLISC
jgi:hypothetical protein